MLKVSACYTLFIVTVACSFAILPAVPIELIQVYPEIHESISFSIGLRRHHLFTAEPDDQCQADCHLFLNHQTQGQRLEQVTGLSDLVIGMLGGAQPLNVTPLWLWHQAFVFIFHLNSP